MVSVGKRFRAPKKRDTKSWKRIAQGDFMTEQSVTDIREQYEQKDKAGRWVWVYDYSTRTYAYKLFPIMIRSRKRKRNIHV